jgi:hypothetical protein
MTTKEYIFYRIVCKNPEIKECYVGSTTNFKIRKQSHKVVVITKTVQTIINMYINLYEPIMAGKIGI